MKLIVALLLSAASYHALAQEPPPSPAPAPARRVVPVMPPELRPAPPPALIESQRNAWNSYTRRPGFKSIQVIYIDKMVLEANSITLNIKGTAYVLKGQPKRVPPHGNVPGATTWHGESPDGFTSGRASFVSMDGEATVEGSLYLGGQTYVIRSAGTVVFLIEADEAPNESHSARNLR